MELSGPEEQVLHTVQLCVAAREAPLKSALSRSLLALHSRALEKTRSRAHSSRWYEFTSVDKQNPAEVEDLGHRARMTPGDRRPEHQLNGTQRGTGLAVQERSKVTSVCGCGGLEPAPPTAP
ncbi:hypothetical protein EYF80_047486 [Liparis tanakae]|uniref:Uncharacterized protein n=1 Tax=Liparis tanakae TaxID=230148 RepID=A0A4Z2FN76_9TELE|nr:hypothetical protein EYF80_047486 [Liparis tanakae]